MVYTSVKFRMKIKNFIDGNVISGVVLSPLLGRGFRGG